MMFYAYLCGKYATSLVVCRETARRKSWTRPQRLGRMQGEDMHSSNKMNNGKYKP